MKNLEQNDVTEAFVRLLITNGTATSLEVKENLRKNDFWVTQKQVSAILSDLVEDENFLDAYDVTYTNNGSYRIYEYHKIDEPVTSVKENTSSVDEIIEFYKTNLPFIKLY